MSEPSTSSTSSGRRWLLSELLLQAVQPVGLLTLCLIGLVTIPVLKLAGIDITPTLPEGQEGWVIAGAVGGGLMLTAVVVITTVVCVIAELRRWKHPDVRKAEKSTDSAGV